MANIHFYIHYFTSGEDRIAIELFRKDNQIETTEFLSCRTYGGGHWIGDLEAGENEELHYRYVLLHNGTTVLREAGPERKLQLSKDKKSIYVQDQWRDRHDPSRIFYSSAFTKVIFAPEMRSLPVAKIKRKKTGNSITFQLDAPDIPAHLAVGITGNTESLGQWKKAVLLDASGYPQWKTTIPVEEQQVILQYKFVLCHPVSGDIVAWEKGDNRHCQFNFPEKNSSFLILTIEGFRHSMPRWRGAGVAIPVFSLRTMRGLGIGEFYDLKETIDLAGSMGMNVVQTLPVNDTIAAKTWKDSYPYSAISVFALHPLYVNLDAIGEFRKKKDTAAMHKDRERLNSLGTVDFTGVLEAKLRYLRILYDERKKTFLASPGFKQFFRENEEWLLPYAAFCYLRDIHGTADFTTWEQHSIYDKDAIEALAWEGSSAYDDIAFYYFVQYHADRQLREVKEYGRKKRVVLKGDLPIGVYRHSCDAWVAPELYHMDGQAGAPPDDYAEDGQNWGFPTYNWEKMAEDDFLWWRRRMQSLARYFDALRIDHILGFFRIWEIPIEQVSGILGRFNPRLPLSRQELAAYGIYGELEKFTQPYIREHMLEALFGGNREYVVKEFLEKEGDAAYSLKANVSTQAQINKRFKLKKYNKVQYLREPLSKLVCEVMLIPESKGTEEGFNPRISLHKTWLYDDMKQEERSRWDALYHYYYYVRHNEFWRKQALWKLPALLEATDMLICGEDLGMIPASVPGVMNELNIVALEIQRMPKGPVAFGRPADYDYMTVCSPSCHDMSTVRGWWESDEARAQQFYNQHMHYPGLAPVECTVDIVRYVNQEHLESPSLLAIFPLQDLLGMDENLRKPDAASEQINDPANSNHYWKYRLHLPLEDLVHEQFFTEAVKNMVKKSGR